jgi:hypothetical protein
MASHFVQHLPLCAAPAKEKTDMNPTATPAGPGRWLPVRDRVTGRLLCEYNPHTGRIRVRRGRRYYTALLPPATRVPRDLAEAAHQLLHQLDADCPEDADDRPDP